MIGSGGISDAVLKEVDGALNHHELIKVRIRSADRAQRAAMLETLLAGSGAELVQRIGHVALIFRRAADPVIALP
jgi:RNA-binding protein